MDIEEVAANSPGEDHHRRRSTRPAGLQPYQCAPGWRSRSSFSGRRRSRQFTKSIADEPLQALRREATAALVEVNPLIVNEATARCWRSTPRSTSTRTRCSGSPGCREWRDHLAGRCEMELNRASGARPQLRVARRQHRLHGERRRPRDGDHGPHQAARRHAGELPRRRRRRHRRARHGGVQADPLEREREGDPRQHLRAASCAAT
jgi:hypothetical protein